MEARLSAGESDSQLLADYAKLQKDLENTMSIWELAQMNLEELEQKFAD